MKEMTAKFSGLLLQLTETREALSQTRGELSQTQRRLRGTEHKLSQTQGELSQTQSRLSGTEHKLSQTQGELSQTQQELKSLKEKSSGFFSAYGPRLAQEPKEAKVRELQRQVPGLLSLVASGEQAKAEELIARDPEILLQAGDVTDGAERCFTGITALQYAVWALDAHMWTMILPYFDRINARASAGEQLRALEEKGTAHGRHFDFKPLLDAYKAFERSPSEESWIRGVGGAQRLLPDHVVQEYTTPDRPFKPTPDFAVADARRPTAHSKHGVSWWRSAEYNQGVLGCAWAAVRMDLGEVRIGRCLPKPRSGRSESHFSRFGGSVHHDVQIFVVCESYCPSHALIVGDYEDVSVSVADMAAIEALCRQRGNELTDLLRRYGVEPTPAAECKSPGRR